MNWKPTAYEKRMLRQVAAKEAGLGPRQIALRAAERNLFGTNQTSFNDWMWGKATCTDLADNGFTMGDFEKLGGCEMNSDGEAYVDFYVYELGNWGHGIEPVELVCNVGAVIDTVDGKPVMIAVDTGKGMVVVPELEDLYGS